MLKRKRRERERENAVKNYESLSKVREKEINSFIFA